MIVLELRADAGGGEIADLVVVIVDADGGGVDRAQAERAVIIRFGERFVLGVGIARALCRRGSADQQGEKRGGDDAQTKRCPPVDRGVRPTGRLDWG